MSKGSDFYGSIFLINSKLKSHRTESAVPALPESGTFAQENGEAMILPVPLASENLSPTIGVPSFLPGQRIQGRKNFFQVNPKLLV